MKSDAVHIENDVAKARLHIGVDVSKDKLDVFVPSEQEGAHAVTMTVDNNLKGFEKIRDFAKRVRAIVCLEPTGGYECGLIVYLHKYDVEVARVDALRVRRFAEAEGTLQKNDQTDAALISRFADKMNVRVLGKEDVEFVELRRKARFRLALVATRTTYAGMLDTETDADTVKCLRKEIRRLNKVIASTEKACDALVEKNDRMKDLKARFTQVGGVADTTAVSVLAWLPEIGTLSDAKLNRLVGISPEEKQSGKREWQNKIWGGRREVRNALYMSAMAALIWNARLAAHYRKKRAEGHPHKWAMVPTMRKVLSLLNKIATKPDFVPLPEPGSTKANAKVGRKKKSA